jgi:hypothetical protein
MMIGRASAIPMTKVPTPTTRAKAIAVPGMA